MLSKRLETCLAFIEEGARLYDVGTDHALLPIAAVQRKRAEHVVALDNKQGPLAQAKRNVAAAGLSARIRLLHADGLSALDKSIDTVTIAGLGGTTIRRIIGGKDLQNVRRFIFQPANHPEAVRMLARKNPLAVIDEEVIEENDILYTVIVMEKGAQELSRKEELFGPVLLQKAPKPLQRELERQKGFLERLLLDIPEEAAKRPLEEKLRLIEEVLHEWNQG